MFEIDPRTDGVEDAILDAALDGYPLAPVPAGLVRRTLARLSPRPQVRFRLEFLDLAVPIFLVVFVILTIWAAIWTLNYVSPYWMLKLSITLEANRQWLLFQAMHLPPWLPVLGVILGAALLTGITAMIILLLERALLSYRMGYRYL